MAAHSRTHDSRQTARPNEHLRVGENQRGNGRSLPQSARIDRRVTLADQIFFRFSSPLVMLDEQGARAKDGGKCESRAANIRTSPAITVAVTPSDDACVIYSEKWTAGDTVLIALASVKISCAKRRIYKASSNSTTRRISETYGRWNIHTTPASHLRTIPGEASEQWWNHSLMRLL